MGTTPANVKRRTVAIIVVAAMMVSALGTVVATRLIRSPAEQAARTAAPEPTPILVAVEERVLSTSIVSRGTGQFGSPRQLAVTSSRLKDGPQVVTSLAPVGTSVREGEVVMTLSGRPVFLLVGAVPSYRDLGPTMAGDDVRQLEEALERLGFDPGRADGVYDAATGDAVARMYRQAAAEPLMASEEQLAVVRPDHAGLVDGALAAAGVQVPADEVIFVPSAPVRVAEHAAELGARADAPLLAVTDSVITVIGALPIEEAGLVAEGMEVAIDEPDLGISATGTVSGVAGQPGTNGADGFHVSFEVTVADAPQALVGASVRLTIPIESTQTAGQVVPVSAVSLGADGSSRVQRSVDGQLEFVPVEPGFSAEGYVTISATGVELAVGDMVVIGLDQAATSG